MNHNLIEARDLTLRYGRKKTAVDRVSFELPKGRVVGLLGHNGAGKTSLMKALVGLKGGEGSLTVLGRSPVKDRADLLTELSYIPDVAVLPRWARVRVMSAVMQGMRA